MGRQPDHPSPDHPSEDIQAQMRDRTEHARPLETYDHAGHTGHGGGHDKHAGHSPKAFRSCFWLSLVLSLPVIYYAEFFQEVFGYQAAQFPASVWVSPVLGTILYLYGGWPFLKGAARELRARQPGMMTLVALAITVAFGYSLAVTLGLPGMPFYWELATLVVIMLLGYWLEMASVQGGSRALEHLASLVPSTAHKLVGDRIEDVPVSDLRAGEHILIRPGEQVPVDGRIVEGGSSVNEAFLTGESHPVSKGVATRWWRARSTATARLLWRSRAQATRPP